MEEVSIETLSVRLYSSYGKVSSSFSSFSQREIFLVCGTESSSLNLLVQDMDWKPELNTGNTVSWIETSQEHVVMFFATLLCFIAMHHECVI